MKITNHKKEITRDGQSFVLKFGLIVFFLTFFSQLLFAQTNLYTEGADMDNSGDGVTYYITSPGTYTWIGSVSTPSDFQDRFTVNIGSGVQIASASYLITGDGSFSGLYGFYANSASVSVGSGAMSSGVGFPMPPGTYNNIFIGTDFSVGNGWKITIVVTALPLAASMSRTNVTCNGGNDGTATVTASAGYPPYTYSWSPSGGTAAAATGLTAGTYSCTVTDASSASLVVSRTITEPTALSITLGSNPSVASGTTTANLPYSATTGSPTSYNITWSSAALSAGFTNVSSVTLPATPIALTVPAAAPGAVYTGTVTVNKSSCTSSGAPFTVTVTGGAGLSATQSHVNVTCNGGSNGSASVVASGGTPGYTYSWAPSGGSAATATSRTAGTYTCTITDGASTSITKTFNITQPSAISTSVSAQTNVAVPTDRLRSVPAVVHRDIPIPGRHQVALLLRLPAARQVAIPVL
jgi:hypothetical protein